MSASRSQLASIQALRAVAALMVVVYHATRVAADRVDNLPRSTVWESGQSGVDLFFVISGLVMGISYYRARSQSWFDFLRRRLTRIVPMYWIATTLKLVPLLAIPALAVHSHFAPWHTVASYLFIPAKNSDGAIYPLLWVGWTLNFEMLFYLLFTVALAARAPILPFLGAAIGSFAVASLFKTEHWPAVLRLADPMLLEFLLGLGLAYGMHKGLALSMVQCALLLVGGSICILIAPDGTDESMARLLFWGLPAFAIVAAVAAMKWEPPNWQLQMGNASYAIYLFHGFVLTAMGLVLARIQFSYLTLLLCCAGGVVISAFLGLAIYQFAEIPLLQKINAWAKRAPGERTVGRH